MTRRFPSDGYDPGISYGALQKSSVDIHVQIGSEDRLMEARSGGSGCAARRRSRFPVHADEPSDLIECSGRSCRACTAILIADCIAIACCPCAVMDLLALAFFKAPLVAGRRFVGLLKKRRRSLVKKSKVGANEKVAEKEMEKKNLEEGDGGVLGKAFGENGNSLEVERVWLEIYEVGHWGFGRVSVSGWA